jgi:hypothetical protein
VSVGGYVALGSPGRSQSDALFVIDTRTGEVTKIADGYAAGASFAPSAPDRLVYGLGRSSPIAGLLNLYTANPDGTAVTQLTHDGHSLNPVWGPRGIAFDRELLPYKYQIYLNANGHSTQITDVHLSSQDQGLVPVAISANGDRLLARFECFQNPQAWTVDLADHRTHELTAARTAVTGMSISNDGLRVLISTVHTVETVPFTGGAIRPLVRDADQPSWNQ